MSTPFELEWMGGAAEHHFRRARPAIDELPWGTLDPSEHPPVAVEFARIAWTDVAISEYRAAAAFAEVSRALLDVKAPLDLIGMAGDFLADECSHVEMASRLAMALGGAEKRNVDPARFTIRPPCPSALQRANELVLRISCIEETFTAGTSAISLQTTSHPLVRAVYETILRDEARHRRLGGLYFEWALSRIDDTERLRLGRVLLSSLQKVAFFWKTVHGARGADLPGEALRALGWLEPIAFAPVALEVVVHDILEPLASIGIAISDEERASLLGRSGTPIERPREAPEGSAQPNPERSSGTSYQLSSTTVQGLTVE